MSLHVVNYLHRKIAKGMYPLDPFQNVHMRNFVVLMVRASTAGEFLHYLDYSHTSERFKIKLNG